MSSSESESENNFEEDLSEEEDNENSSENEAESMEEDSDNEEQDEGERTEIRDELKTMSFEELIKLKEKLGAKVYNEAMFGEAASSSQTKKPKSRSEFKRANANRPMELSSKFQVPFGMEKKSRKAAEETIVDPRFNANCGEFDSRTFKKRYEFVNEMRETELNELQTKLKMTTDEEEVKNLKFVMLRLKNKLVEENKRKKRLEEEVEEREIRKVEQKDNQNPFYMKKSHKTAHDLVKKYLELKSTGKLEKHLEKRRKKSKARDRKKFNF